jgi:hypothetical protein
VTNVLDSAADQFAGYQLLVPSGPHHYQADYTGLKVQQTLSDVGSERRVHETKAQPLLVERQD